MNQPKERLPNTVRRRCVRKMLLVKGGIPQIKDMATVLNATRMTIRADMRGLAHDPKIANALAGRGSERLLGQSNVIPVSVLESTRDRMLKGTERIIQGMAMRGKRQGDMAKTLGLPRETIAKYRMRLLQQAETGNDAKLIKALRKGYRPGDSVSIKDAIREGVMTRELQESMITRLNISPQTAAKFRRKLLQDATGRIQDGCPAPDDARLIEALKLYRPGRRPGTRSYSPSKAVERRTDVLKMALAGQRQHQIRKTLGVLRATVSMDVKLLRRQAEERVNRRVAIPDDLRAIEALKKLQR